MSFFGQITLFVSIKQMVAIIMYDDVYILNAAYFYCE